MELTPAERLSPLWMKLHGFFEERLRSHRLALELSDKDAEKLRGRIAEDKFFLDLNEEVSPTIPNLEV